MKTETFLERVRRDLEMILPLEQGNSSICLRQVKDMQGNCQNVLFISRPNDTWEVGFGISQMYERFCNGERYEKLLRELVNTINVEVVRTPLILLHKTDSYEMMISKLSFQAVNLQRCEQLLVEVPHWEMEDLAIVCRFDAILIDGCWIRGFVTNQMLENYGISRDQLFQDVRREASVYRPAYVCNMAQAARKGRQVSPEETKCIVYVAFALGDEYGAGVIAYPGFFEQASATLGGDFYLLSASAREWYLMPDREPLRADLLFYMGICIADEIAPNDRLTDTLYHYDCKAKCFETVHHYLTRKALEKGAYA